MNTQTKESQASMTPEMALKMLVDGNERFVNNSGTKRNLMEQVNETKEGQFPFATVLSCIDSRVPVELIFDQGIGDVFSVRIAGNVLNDDILGSMEFASKLAGSKLIVVLGHSRCGAINGAIGGAKLGNLTGLLEKIAPAISAVKKGSNLEAGSGQFMDEVVKQNTIDVAEMIPQKSKVLAEMMEESEIAIVRGVYHVETGDVIFSN